MSILVVLEANAKPGNAKDITNLLRDELHHTRSFDGCNGLTFHNQNDPDHLVKNYRKGGKQWYCDVPRTRTYRS